MCCICLCQRHNQIPGRNRLSRLSNMKGTERDLRLQQATMMLFIVFVIVVVLGIVSDDRTPDAQLRGRKKLLAFCAVFSYGVLYGLERGNILLLCWPLMAFLSCTAIQKNHFAGAGLSGTGDCRRFQAVPGVSGVLLLRDKNYLPRCARCCTVLFACASRCSSSMKDCLASHCGSVYCLILVAAEWNRGSAMVSPTFWQRPDMVGQAAGHAAGLWQLRTAGHCAGSGAAGVQLFYG